MGSEGPLGYRDSSHVLYSRVIEQSVLKTLGRRAGIQVSPTGRYMSAMLRALISFSSFWPTSTLLLSSLNGF